MATTKTTKPASKKSSSAVKKKVSNILTGPLKDTKKAAGKAIAFGVKAAKSGAKTYIESEKRMLKDVKEGAKTAAKPFMPAVDAMKKIAKKVTVKNASKALNAKSGNNRPSVIKNSNASKFQNSGPKYARGGAARKLKRYQSEGEVKATTPTVTPAETTAIKPAPSVTNVPAATTTAAPAERTFAQVYKDNRAAGMRHGVAKRMAKKETGMSVAVDPNKILDTVNTAGSVVNTVLQNRANANGSGSGPFKKGGMVKRKLMKASEGVIVKMNGNQPVQKNAGSKGVKSGVNTAAKASKATKGRSGGTSKAPKTAIPKAKYGMSMKGKSC